MTSSKLSIRWAISTASVIVVTLAVEILCQSGVLPPQIPAPSVVAGAAANQFQSGTFWEAFGHTGYQWGVGLVFGIILGVVLGIATAGSRVISQLVLIPFEFLRPIPPIVYLPLFLLLAGASDGVSIVLTALAAFWPVYFQTYYGAKEVDGYALETARMFGLTRLQRFTAVTLPGISPSIATGIRVAAAIALIVSITMELVGGIPGLGAELRAYQINGVYPEVYALILVMGVMGLVLNSGLEIFERRLLRWHTPYRRVS